MRMKPALAPCILAFSLCGGAFALGEDIQPSGASGEAAHASPLAPQTQPIAVASSEAALAPASGPSLQDSSTDAAPASELLGAIYMSHAAGIALRPPKGCVLLGRADANHVAQWSDEKRHWTLKLSSISLKESRPLQTYVGRDGKPVLGLLDVTVDNLKRQFPGGQVLRQDVSSFAGGRVVSDDVNVDPRLKGFVVDNPISKNNVGLVAFRYTAEARRHLTQQAIFQASEELYYVLTLTTPGSDAAPTTSTAAPEDPGERAAVDSFHEVLDSVQLLDRARIRHDQDERLFRTRSFYVNLDANMAKLRSALFDEQWFRILQNGKDIGYTYISEERARGIPRLDEDTAKRLREDRLTDQEKKQTMLKPKVADGDGILIGVRSRLVTEAIRSNKTKGPIQTDTESWLFVSPARMHEDWSNLTVMDELIGTKRVYTEEFGASDRHMVNIKDEGASLSVSQASNMVTLDPINRDLPKYYLPQALSHLLPRILPLKDQKSYLFATFMSTAREVMHRYIDVGKPTEVTLAGQQITAIPVSDRVGLEGSLTIHYISPTPDAQGRYRYLGSYNKDSDIAVVATDAESLMQRWKGVVLNRPSAVTHPALKPAPERVIDAPRTNDAPTSTGLQELPQPK